MAVTHTLYGPFMKNLASSGAAGNETRLGSLDTTSTERFSVILMSSDFVFNQAHEYWAQVSSDQQSTDFAGSTDYEAGGKPLAERSLAYSNRVTTWSASTYTSFSTGGNIIGFFAVVAASSYLVSCVDFGGEEKSVAGEFKINWTDAKVLTMTVGT
jgi:hypothetical protein